MGNSNLSIWITFLDKIYYTAKNIYSRKNLLPDFFPKNKNWVVIVDNQGIVEGMFDDPWNWHSESVVERGGQVVFAQQNIQILQQQNWWGKSKPG